MEPLDGTNYNRWSQKLLIFFEQLDVDYVVFQNPPETPVEASVLAITTTDTTTIGTTKSEDEAKHKYDRDNKTVRGHLLNHMNNSLFDLFVNYRSAKDIWTTLETRYGGDDAGRKKYFVGKWLQFQMIDEKPIMDQIHEYENLVADVLSEGMKMCEILQTNVLLAKFPSTWSEYRNHLKHKKRDLTLQGLIDHMRTEEANRLKDKETSLSSLSIKANLVESARSKDMFYQNKGKKFQKNNHHKSFKAPDEAYLVENKEDWILDTGAFRHFCSNKALIHELLETTDGECVFMGNSTTAGVLGKGKILLKLTSGKTLALIDVLYVPSLRRNLVSGRKGYSSDGLFVLNTIPVMFNKNSSNSAYLIESIDVWHEAKYAKKPFKSVTSRSIEVLELIHSDLADFKNTLNKGDEATEMFLKFKVEVENQLEKKIKRLRSNRGGEYKTKFLKEFCEINGTIYEMSATYTPQQNGIAERKNRTLKEMMNAMLLSSETIKETKRFLLAQFDMKDLGEADVILGVKIRKTENGYSLCQSQYIKKILEKFGYQDEIPTRTPYDPSICLKKNKGDSVSQAEYAKIVGSVMFLMNYTRPNITYAHCPEVNGCGDISPWLALSPESNMTDRACMRRSPLAPKACVMQVLILYTARGECYAL
ncbi:Retrovirus-related Pol polyprotein from transposon TNT 1-94 [Sesamum angolense]|uniref:Retrovirus-related Pol polyprotein from transposon TNT 1-94 n=1 Tax=Sesamum angolense TaxID=2727404 RepID=A0AAE2C0F3_9LAMI|nr:Retrovirus-related Pol polyprotein from transposon TNT 1-94 [Sesamum angolense]